MHVQPSRIVFERRLPTAARREEDDWTGLSDARIRRRIQNRLNQRTYRLRRAAERAAEQASATCSPQTLVPLAPKEVVPAADPEIKVNQMQSKRDDSFHNVARHQVTLSPQPVLCRISSSEPACTALLANPKVRRVYDYTVKTLWPSFKHHSLETNESLTSAFLHLSLVDELLLNSFIWTAAMAMSMHLRHTASDNETVMFTCQNKAVQGIREHIARNEVSDSVIFGVLALTIRDTNPHVAVQEAAGEDCFGGFDPPLRSLGWIQYFSHFRWTPSHIRATIALVAARGGLRGVTMPGIAEQIQSTDLLQASLSIRRPYFTLCRLYQHVLDNHVKLIRPPRERLDEAFPAIADAEFKDLLLDMRMYCRELDRVVATTTTTTTTAAAAAAAAAESNLSEAGSGPDPDNPGARVSGWETNVYRNLIQYRLLRLPRYENREEELCRLGAMIFSYGVIYPVARPRPLRMLVAQLRNALEDFLLRTSSTPKINIKAPTPASHDGSGKYSRYPTHHSTSTTTATTDGQCSVPPPSYPPSAFLLWLAVLGALASQTTADEPFFLDLVASWSTTVMGIDSPHRQFTHFRELMRNFLWLDRACDKGARKVWTRLRPAGRGDGDDCREERERERKPGTNSEKESGIHSSASMSQQKHPQPHESQGERNKAGRTPGSGSGSGSWHFGDLICPE
ncbi:hypothetical protein AYO21_10408 [Fonsecaea monophora]|uniref:BZIP domain-containing protein n=1 Tax=Fonsecaea monophora TaxID=254056 RepID=A0A177ETW5_9EURO|nr:hypothetical protein AYO21_10408 [Fonsecaea monophora]OAG35398.1 hypothetical protein AYO21_10408 [Fonsecaea monophora]